MKPIVTIIAVLVAGAFFAIVCEGIVFAAGETVPQIAFGAVKTRTDSDIHAMGIDGSNYRQLTDQPGGGATPSWFPDGTKIVYVAAPNGKADIHVKDFSTGGVRSLGVYGFQPTWSPDGRQIAYVDGIQGVGLYVMNADGSSSHPVFLSDHGWPVSDPEWSPDGTKIVFETHWQVRFGNRISPSKGQVHVVSADGFDRRELTAPSGPDDVTSCVSPTWSPDGDRIAFVRVDGITDSIWMMDSDGRNKREIVATKGGAGDLAWVPYSERLVFADVGVGGRLDVYIVNSDGSGLENLTNTGNLSELFPDAFDPSKVFSPPPVFPAWDVNEDGRVNILDLVIIGSQFGQVGADLTGDVNDDGRVNIFDLVVVGSHFGESSVAAAPAGVKTKLAADQVTTVQDLLEKLQTYDGDPLEGIEKAIANLKKIRDGYDPSRPVEPKNKRFTTWGAQKAVR